MQVGPGIAPLYLVARVGDLEDDDPADSDDEVDDLDIPVLDGEQGNNPGVEIAMPVLRKRLSTTAWSDKRADGSLQAQRLTSFDAHIAPRPLFSHRYAFDIPFGVS